MDNHFCDPWRYLCQAQPRLQLQLGCTLILIGLGIGIILSVLYNYMTSV